MVMLVDGGGSRTVTATPVKREDPPPQEQLDPAKGAQRVLDTGSRWGTDDYDARVVALADELAKGDPLYREQLMREIFKQDPNALNSWLQAERANRMQDDGRISISEKGSIAEGLAAAYNNGDIPKSDQYAGPVPGTAEDGKVLGATDLDQQLLKGFTSGDHDGQVRNADEVAQFLKFMNSSSGPESTEFRQKFSQHLIDQYVLNPAVKYNDVDQQQVAATLAGNLLGATPEQSAKNLSAEVLQKYDDEQIKTILEAAGQGTGYLNHQNVHVAAEGGNRFIDSVQVSDGASLLIQNVASTNSPAADKVAVSMARLPATAGDLFSGDAGKGRESAMGNLFANHSKPILDRYTDFDTKKIGTKDDADLKQYMQNASELGALFNTVLFNGDQPYADQARTAVLDYAAGLKESINTEGSSAEAMNRLAMLGASADDAITQGFTELKEDEDAQKEMVGFFVELAFSALPTDVLTNKTDTLIDNLFKNNPQIAESLKGVSGQVVDEATGKLTDEAKAALEKTVGVDEAEMLDQQGASNTLRESLLTGINDQDRLFGLQQASENIAQGINIWRK
jgi:hypothetical protein